VASFSLVVAGPWPRNFYLSMCHCLLEFAHTPSIESTAPISSRVLNNHGMQTLSLLLLNINGLHIAIQLLLGALFVVSLSADAHAQSEGDAFDAALPDFLV
jgi:hypothetical protein